MRDALDATTADKNTINPSKLAGRKHSVDANIGVIETEITGSYYF